MTTSYLRHSAASSQVSGFNVKRYSTYSRDTCSVNEFDWDPNEPDSKIANSLNNHISVSEVRTAQMPIKLEPAQLQAAEKKLLIDVRNPSVANFNDLAAPEKVGFCKLSNIISFGSNCLK